MKIEIGESLVYSWLRHVKKCQIVQTNWKPSPVWEKRDVNLSVVMELINKEFANSGFDIFGKNKLEQLIKQAEIDVLGVFDDHNGTEPHYYFVEVAYHDGGLNYGNTQKTIANVIKKLSRAYFVFRSYFSDGENCSIIFVSPKASIDTFVNPLKENLRILKDLLYQNNFNPDIQLLVNEDFQKEIMSPTLANIRHVSDSNELFLRSIQLMQLSEQFKRRLTNDPIANQPRQRNAQNLIANENHNGEQNQQFIRTRLSNLSNLNLLQRIDIINLLNKNFCEQNFNMHYPILKETNENIYDHTGMARYYVHPITLLDKEYWLCSQWYPIQRSRFQYWYDQKKNL